MDFKVLIAESAIDDLQQIVEFVAADNPEAAASLGERILSHALSLVRMPQRFAFHDKQRGVRKMPLQPFLIYYVCDEAALAVNILHIWHGARRPPEFPDRG